MVKHYQVEQIIAYLTGKVETIRKKLSEYETPIMQEMVKGSPHLQFDYIRLKAELQSLEDVLLAIDKFTDLPPISNLTDEKTGKNRQSRKK